MNDDDDAKCAVCAVPVTDLDHGCQAEDCNAPLCPTHGQDGEGHCPEHQPVDVGSIASISAPTPAPSHDYVAVDLPVDTLERLRGWLCDQITMGADDETEVPFIKVVLDGIEDAFKREHDFSDSTGYCARCGHPSDDEEQPLPPTCKGGHDL